MLIRFEVANFRSILDPVELSMVAVDRDRDEARPVDNIGESLLSVAAIYGPNASGKSNTIAALAWLRSAVMESLRFWDDEVPVEPFAFQGGQNRHSEFTVEFVAGDVRFEYIVELNRERIHYEALFHYPESRRRRIFEREGESLKLQRGLGKLSGARDLLTPRTLALSVARRFDEPSINTFVHEFFDIRTLGLKPVGRRFLPLNSGRSTLRWFEDLSSRDQPTLPGLAEIDRDVQADRALALALLRSADLGISDVKVDDEEIVYSSADGESERTRTRRRVRLVHESAGEQYPLDFAAESEGTRTWFQLIGPVLGALRSGSLLLFDELDGSLHPTLSAQLIRLFHEPKTNPLGAQLVFTTHDTSLLNHLNRDEVWFTDKDERGMTQLGALAEFAGARVRQSQNLERAYLHGRFGALPEVDRTEMLRALGLIG